MTVAAKVDGNDLLAKTLLLAGALALGACSGGGLAPGLDGSGPDQRVGDQRVGDQRVADRGFGDGDASGTDQGGGIDGAGRPGAISIYVAGDQTAVTFNDGLAGQTPRDYEIAISRYAALRSANDPAPVQCFDHGNKPVVTNMTRDTFVGACDTANIPTGTYTHGRTKVDWARYTVDGVYHLPGLPPITGKLTMFRAYSDTRYAGKDYKAGTGLLTVHGPTTIEIPMTYPSPPGVPGFVSFQTVAGELFMTFLYSRPLLIQKGNPEAHWARFHWKVKDSFRWKDRALSGYKSGAWDLSVDPLQSEVPSMYGVSSYYVTASTD